MDYEGQALLRSGEALPQVAAQLRKMLSNVYYAAVRLAPPEQRDENRELDENAALLSQGLHQLLRLSCQMELAATLELMDTMETEDTELVAWLEELLREAQPLFELRDVTLTLETELSRHTAAVHPLYLRRAMWQLLSNALKYTAPGGHVTVTLQCEHQQVLFRVADNGCGIPAEKLEYVFRLLGQPGRLPQHPNGIGLGLPMARRIAVLHGGRLLLESQEGQGTRVTLALPNRRTDHRLEQRNLDYTGGFQPPLLELSDGLPRRAFLLRHLND